MDDTQRKSLDEIYSASEAKAEPAADTGAPAPVEAPAAPQALPEPTGTGTGTPPVPNPGRPDGFVPLAALDDSRRKNQHLERQLAELRAQQAQPVRADDDDAPDPLVDPKAFRDYQKMEREVERFQDRLDITTELIIKDVGEAEWDAAKNALLDYATRFPDAGGQIGKELAKSRNPARRSYEIGKEIIEAQERNDPVKHRAALEAEITAKLRAELGLTAPASAAVQAPTAGKAPAPRVPTSLASHQSVGSRNAGARPIGRRSLDELYG